MHDRLYDLGFTEGAGNFQQTNFARGGVGGDPVLVDIHDGASVGKFNHAFENAAAVPIDGSAGRISLGSLISQTRTGTAPWTLRSSCMNTRIS